MISCRFQNDNRRAIFTRAVAAWTSKSVNIHDPAVPTSHNGQPSLKVPTQYLVLLGRMRVQIPGCTERFRHKVLSKITVLVQSPLRVSFGSYYYYAPNRGIGEYLKPLFSKNINSHSLSGVCPRISGGAFLSTPPPQNSRHLLQSKGSISRPAMHLIPPK
jgi:hypothetical protein